MAGTFSKSTLPKRPGAYFNFQSRKPEPTLVNTLGTIAVGATHSWGPVNQVVELNSFGDFLAKFSQGGTTPPTYTDGYRAIRDAFKGEGLPGYGGAGKVLFYRLAGTSKAKAAKQLSNGVTPAITLTALYEGTFGNTLGAAVVADPTDPTNKHNLVIYVGGVEAERFAYAKTNITDLAAQINGTSPYNASSASDWVSAGSVTSGTALTLVAVSNLTAGNDGTTLVAGDYTAAQTALEPYRFSVLTFDNLTDPTVQAALKTWAVNLNSKGKRFITVIGGAAAETMATAITRSATFADPNFVNVGGGSYSDADFGVLSTAQLTARIAGIIAQRGVTAEITFARLAGLSISSGMTDADLTSALGGGVVAIGRDSHPTSPLRLELGVTTFIDTTQTAFPVAVYGQLKFVRVMHDIETELTEWAEQNVIGKMQVNDATRDFVRGQAQSRMAVRERAGVILPGWSVSTDTNPPPTPTDTFVALLYQVTLGRGLQQILNTVVVG